MTPADFASWLLRHLETDTWFTVATLQRRLAGVSGQAFTPARLLSAMLAAGWLEQHPTYPETYCLPAKCWWPIHKTKETAAGANCVGLDKALLTSTTKV